MFTVFSVWADDRGLCRDCHEFSTERAARAWINAHADGTRSYTLRGPDGEVIVTSSWPVLQVA